MVVIAAMFALGLMALLQLRSSRPTTGAEGVRAVEAAYQQQRSGIWVEVDGRVERRLSDDLEGSRHQRFVIELENGRTLLISHNIDLAPSVPVELGDRVTVRGEYVWNERGGLLHWTHHDPQGELAGGWIRYRGETYR